MRFLQFAFMILTIIPFCFMQSSSQHLYVKDSIERIDQKKAFLKPKELTKSKEPSPCNLDDQVEKKTENRNTQPHKRLKK